MFIKPKATFIIDTESICSIEDSLNKNDCKKIYRLNRIYNKKIKNAYLRYRKRKYDLEIQKINDINKIEKKVDTSNMTASKFFMLFILINCSIIELYSMVAMYRMSDLSALSSLIVAVVTESISYAIYCAKAYRSKKSEVQAELDRDKFEFEKENALQEIECYDAEEEPEVVLGGRLFRKRKG